MKKQRDTSQNIAFIAGHISLLILITYFSEVKEISCIIPFVIIKVFLTMEGGKKSIK